MITWTSLVVVLVIWDVHLAVCPGVLGEFSVLAQDFVPVVLWRCCQFPGIFWSYWLWLKVSEWPSTISLLCGPMRSKVSETWLLEFVKCADSSLSETAEVVLDSSIAEVGWGIVYSSPHYIIPYTNKETKYQTSHPCSGGEINEEAGLVDHTPKKANDWCVIWKEEGSLVEVFQYWPCSSSWGSNDKNLT